MPCLMVSQSRIPPQAANAQEVIIKLKRAEELTSPSAQELMEMDDREREQRDREAGAEFLMAGQMIEGIQQLSRDAIQRILDHKMLEEVSRECEAMGVSFNVMVQWQLRQIPLPQYLVKNYNIAGMRCVNVQARFIREALERELGQL